MNIKNKFGGILSGIGDYVMSKVVTIVVFINYSSKDFEHAEKITSILKKYPGVKTFMAPQSIPPGKNFKEIIIKNIMNCQIFIPIISSKSVHSPFTQQEIGLAIGNKTKLFPVIVGIENYKKLDFLSDYQYIAINDPTLKEKLRKLFFWEYLKAVGIYLFLIIFIIYSKIKG